MVYHLKQGRSTNVVILKVGLYTKQQCSPWIYYSHPPSYKAHYSLMLEHQTLTA
jgi:hypothetical protein